MGTCLVYQVDDGLSIVLTETHYCLDLVPVREDGHNQGDPFMGIEGVTNQTIPRVRGCWLAGGYDRHLPTIVIVRIAKLIVGPGRMLSTLMRLLQVNERGRGCHPSIGAAVCGRHEQSARCRRMIYIPGASLSPRGAREREAGRR